MKTGLEKSSPVSFSLWQRISKYHELSFLRDNPTYVGNMIMLGDNPTTVEKILCGIYYTLIIAPSAHKQRVIFISFFTFFCAYDSSGFEILAVVSLESSLPEYHARFLRTLLDA